MRLSAITEDDRANLPRHHILIQISENKTRMDSNDNKHTTKPNLTNSKSNDLKDKLPKDNSYYQELIRRKRKLKSDNNNMLR